MAPHQLILSVNAGSSSLKISVFKPEKSVKDHVSLLLTASFSEIYSSKASFSLKSSSDAIKAPEVKKSEIDEKGHEAAFKYFLNYLGDKTDLNSDSIAHVCHRIVHGGTLHGPVIVSEDVYRQLTDLEDLAPLHNASALAVIKACLKLLPNSDSIAFFDTTFHSSIPEYISTYAIDPSIASEKKLKKYGFHGLSYSFILRSVATYLEKPSDQTTLIVLHLGSGASVCAIQNGNSLDTSMGLTPLDGLPGATRSGSVDPSLIFHFVDSPSEIKSDPTGQSHLTVAEETLNNHAGWSALTGTKNFGDIASRASPEFSTTCPHPKETLAYHLFIDRILGFIGSYYVKLGGSPKIDAIVFAGGIGEKSSRLRKDVLERCRCLGFPGADEKANEADESSSGPVVSIGEASESEGRIKALVCWTDEQLEMAREWVHHPEFASQNAK